MFGSDTRHPRRRRHRTIEKATQPAILRLLRTRFNPSAGSIKLSKQIADRANHRHNAVARHIIQGEIMIRPVIALKRPNVGRLILARASSNIRSETYPVQQIFGLVKYAASHRGLEPLSLNGKSQTTVDFIRLPDQKGVIRVAADIQLNVTHDFSP